MDADDAKGPTATARIAKVVEEEEYCPSSVGVGPDPEIDAGMVG